MKRAAHFLLFPQLSYSPPNEAIIDALLELGYEIDIYSPDGEAPTEQFGEKVRAHPVAYGKRWIARNVFSPRWRRYNVFSGGCEDPMSVVGLLSWLHQRPSLTLADEIFSGSYRGNAPERWKRLCRWAVKRSRLSVVNDASRISVLREYIGLSDSQPVIVYPGCFREPPPPADRAALRKAWGFPSDGLVITSSGGFNSDTGGEWLINAVQARSDLYLLIQPLGLDRLSRFLISQCRASERICVDDQRLGYRGTWATMAGVDIGMVFYFHPGPQFGNMGVSSNRLCMFLSMGVPVIASRQPSFEFLEQYECGVLVEDENEVVDAISAIEKRLPEMKTNALRCVREYIDPAGKYEGLKAALKTFC